MKLIEERPMPGARGSVGSRANAFMVKTLAVITGGIVLASAFVLSLVFFAVALAVVVLGGGYLWWKTRHLRKQLRAQMDAQMSAHMSEMQARRRGASTSDVIEGVVISREESPRDDSASR